MLPRHFRGASAVLPAKLLVCVSLSVCVSVLLFVHVCVSARHLSVSVSACQSVTPPAPWKCTKGGNERLNATIERRSDGYKQTGNVQHLNRQRELTIDVFIIPPASADLPPASAVKESG